MTPLPPETPILDLLAAVNEHLHVQTGKPGSFFAIPRKLALRLVSERATKLGKIVPDAHVATLLDARVPALLLAMPVEEGKPAVPILAIDMPAPLVAGWTWPVPRFASREGFCEHPEYVGTPFSTQMWDEGHAAAIPSLIAKVHRWCIDHAKRRPALAFQPCAAQEAQARPLMAPRQPKPEDLPQDPEEAKAAMLAGFEQRHDEIERTLNTTGMVGIEFNGDLPDGLPALLVETFRSRHNAACEIGPHPQKPGWLALVATRPVEEEESPQTETPTP